MIIRENIEINGKNFIKTYSDKGFMIERDGIKYTEAIDPEKFNDRIYIETDVEIINIDDNIED